MPGRLLLVVMAGIMIGMRVATWWPLDERWYAGAVDDISDGKTLIRYRDGDMEWIDMNKIKWQVDSTVYRAVDPAGVISEDVVELSFDDGRAVVTCSCCGKDICSSSYAAERGRKKQYIRQLVVTFGRQHGVDLCTSSRSVGDAQSGGTGAPPPPINAKFVSASLAVSDDVVFFEEQCVLKLGCLGCQR